MSYQRLLIESINSIDHLTEGDLSLRVLSKYWESAVGSDALRSEVRDALVADEIVSYDALEEVPTDIWDAVTSEIRVFEIPGKGFQAASLIELLVPQDDIDDGYQSMVKSVYGGDETAATRDRGRAALKELSRLATKAGLRREWFIDAGFVWSGTWPEIKALRQTLPGWEMNSIVDWEGIRTA